MQAGRASEVKRVILTASGGPFRKHTREQLASVTIADALHHPDLGHGPKITVDSATMMNKALEIIEARWLFDLAAEQIDVVVHPQSIVHSLVEFVDGSVDGPAQPARHEAADSICLDLSRADCRAWPAVGFDAKVCTLDFEPPDVERFPALALGLEVARSRRHGRRRAQCGE